MNTSVVTHATSYFVRAVFVKAYLNLKTMKPSSFYVLAGTICMTLGVSIGSYEAVQKQSSLNLVSIELGQTRVSKNHVIKSISETNDSSSLPLFEKELENLNATEKSLNERILKLESKKPFADESVLLLLAGATGLLTAPTVLGSMFKGSQTNNSQESSLPPSSSIGVSGETLSIGDNNIIISCSSDKTDNLASIIDNLNVSDLRNQNKKISGTQEPDANNDSLDTSNSPKSLPSSPVEKLSLGETLEGEYIPSNRTTDS